MPLAGKIFSPRFAVVMLVLTCALWGTSFAIVKICGEIIMGFAAPGTSKAFGPVLLSALRFTFGIPLLLLLWRESRTWRPARSDWLPLLQVAIPSTVGFLIQAAGLAFTTATISGFITGLCVCVTPGVEWMLLGKRPTWRLLGGVLLAIVGVAMLTLTRGGPITFGWGEALTLLCTFAFTLQIVYTGRSSEKLGAARLTLGTFVMIMVCAWLAVIVLGAGSIVPVLAGLAVNSRFWMYFALLLFGSTIGAGMLMNTFQRYIRPSEAAIVYTTEPLFAGAFALVFIGMQELPGGWGLAGAALMIAANLLVVAKAEETETARGNAEPGKV